MPAAQIAMRCIFSLRGNWGSRGRRTLLLATLMPITHRGRDGHFNRHLRSASVEALKQSKVLVIERSPFEFMLRADQAMRVRI